MEEFNYPVYLSLAGRNCLIVGYGNVGRRKLKGLLQSAPKSILVIDRQFGAGGVPESSHPTLRFEERQWTCLDILESNLVFAATDDHNENAKICEICQKQDILCCDITQPDRGNFILPAIIRQQNLCLAISTGGASPLLAARWKEELQPWVKDKAVTAWLMGALRPFIINHSPNKTKDKLELVAASPLSSWLKDSEYGKCQEWLKKNLDLDPNDQIFKIIRDYERIFT